MVAVIQLAIALGSTVGGLLFDSTGLPEHFRGERGRAAVRGFPDLPDLAFASAASGLSRTSHQENPMTMSLDTSRNGHRQTAVERRATRRPAGHPRAGPALRPARAWRVQCRPARRFAASTIAARCNRPTGGITHVDDRRRTSLRHHPGRHRSRPRLRRDAAADDRHGRPQQQREARGAAEGAADECQTGPARYATATSCCTGREPWSSSI